MTEETVVRLDLTKEQAEMMLAAIAIVTDLTPNTTWLPAEGEILLNVNRNLGIAAFATIGGIQCTKELKELATPDRVHEAVARMAAGMSELSRIGASIGTALNIPRS